jgi:hypothetical protein
VDLKPCPFCGQPPEVNESGWAVTIHCANETCEVGCETAGTERGDTARAWNRRIPDAAQPVAWTNKEQLGFLKSREYDGIPMAMWSQKGAMANIPLYAAQPPAAPVEVRCDNCRITLKPNEVAPLCERCRENYPALARISAGNEHLIDELAQIIDYRAHHEYPNERLRHRNHHADAIHLLAEDDASPPRIL